MSRNNLTVERRKNLVNDILRINAILIVALVTFSIVLLRTLQLSGIFPWKVLGLFLVGSALTLILATLHFPSRSFGPANQVTLARAALVALLFGLIGEPLVPWLVVIVASFVLVLDGVDGWLARRFGVASDFGARFDMETDAVLLVALVALAWQYQKAGPWIILAALMRYCFVASSYFFLWLSRPLPPKRRRQTAYVIQVVTLIVCISPVVVQPLSGAIALLGLAVLSLSFAIDVAHLTRDSGDLVEHSRT